MQSPPPLWPVVAVFGRLIRAVSCLAVLTLACTAYGQHEGHEAAAGESADAPVVFLDKNPRIVAYQLNRLSNAQLLRVSRDSADKKYVPVHEAILGRAGMDEAHRLEAARALAKLRQTDVVAEIIGAVQRLDSEDSPPILRELGRLLAAQAPADLSKHRPELEALATEGTQPAQREDALAALAAFEPAETLWSFAEAKQATALLLSGLPLQPAAERRAAYFGHIEALLRPETEPAVLRGALAAAVTIPDQAGPVFTACLRLLGAGVERAAVVQAFQSIAQERWPAEQLPGLAAAIVAQAKQAPSSQRTEADYLDMMQLGQDLASRLPPAEGVRLRKTLAGLGATIIRLRTLREQMYFDKTTLVVEAGQPVAILLENTDAMQHNLVIVAPGALEEIGTAAEKMPPTPDSAGRLYVPASPKVLWATRLLGPGERTKLEFIAPTQPDRYPFACTYPTHWLRMRGTLLVVSKLQEYLEHAPAEAPAPQVTEWKTSDFAAEFEHWMPRADSEKGKAVFTTAGCIACHQVQGLGAVYGPNLSSVFAKYKNNPQTVLGEILDPSKNIEPRYRSYNFKLADEDTLTGFILAEDQDSITIQSGPAQSLIQKYPKKQIEGREPQPLSVMPSGLLSVLSKDQIRDLLSFLANASAQSNSTGPTSSTAH